MTVHIGNEIKTEVEHKRLTQKKFAALIHRHEKSVSDIYDRASMSTELLVTISAVLKKDFLSFLYAEEPMKSLQDDEITKLNHQLQKITEENIHLQRELALTQNLNGAHQETISFAKEQIEAYKLRLTELVNKVADQMIRQV